MNSNTTPLPSAPLTLGQAIAKSAEFLRDKGVDSPRLDAELLLAHALGCDRLKLYLQWDRPLNEAEKEQMRDALRRRGGAREPVARIVGQREFFGRPFRVGRDAFVPRPETEWLVERALALIAEMPDVKIESSVMNADAENSGSGAPCVIDIGTGSGCIAISVALECPRAAVTATEISEETLRVARDNASALGAVGRVRFLRGDLFAEAEGPFDLVISNPPYIASEAIAGLMPEVAEHDPRRALDGGAGGLEVFRRLAADAPPRMKPGARMLLEIGEGQGSEVAEILKSTDAFEDIRVVRDLAGLERYVEASRRQ